MQSPFAVNDVALSILGDGSMKSIRFHTFLILKTMSFRKRMGQTGQR